ncbi:Anoctamin-7 [Blyttiomyces sp. JEL0837]|nr:Anoctamin-7 [Blyttiomyces sp. JEL0837]
MNTPSTGGHHPDAAESAGVRGRSHINTTQSNIENDRHDRHGGPHIWSHLFDRKKQQQLRHSDYECEPALNSHHTIAAATSTNSITKPQVSVPVKAPITATANAPIAPQGQQPLNNSFSTAKSSLSQLVPPAFALEQEFEMYPHVSYRNSEDNSVVFVMHQRDAAFWDEVVQWKKRVESLPGPSYQGNKNGNGNGAATGTIMDWAFDYFEKREYSDAVIRCVFAQKADNIEVLKSINSTNMPRFLPAKESAARNAHVWSTVWDSVLKYDLQNAPTMAKAQPRRSWSNVSAGDVSNVNPALRRFDFVRHVTGDLFRVILAFEWGGASERYIKLLVPFETLCYEAQAIELVKTLRPGLVRLPTGRFADDIHDEVKEKFTNPPSAPPSTMDSPPSPISQMHSHSDAGTDSVNGYGRGSSRGQINDNSKQSVDNTLKHPTRHVGSWFQPIHESMHGAIPETANSELEEGPPFESTPAIPHSNLKLEVTHPYLPPTSSFETFKKLIWPLEASHDRHSDRFRTDHLKDFEGGNLYSIEIKANFFKSSQRNNLATSVLVRSQIDITRLLEDKVFTSHFCLHDSPINRAILPPKSRYFHHCNVRYYLYKNLKHSWKNPLLFIAYDPSEGFRFYFGEKIALYFAWLVFYTKFLWSAAFIGLIVFVYGVHRSYNVSQDQQFLSIFDNELTPVFSLIMSVWATLFLEFWQRQSTFLAHLWNVSEFERGEKIRPQWRHVKSTIMNPISQKWEYYDPKIYRVMRRTGTAFVIIFFIGVNSFVVACVIIYRAWAKNLVSVPYASLARILTDFDNYRSESGYQNALILKNFLLAVVNSYASLFYVGIVKSILSAPESSNLLLGVYADNCEYLLGSRSCMSELMVQMCITFVGVQFAHQIQELFMPWVTSKYQEYKSKNESKRIGAFEREEFAPTFTDEDLGLDYLIKVIQFGFITLFSCAFPLAPLFALVNNMSELRVDSYKLLAQYRRPFASRAQSIGLVQHLLLAVSNVGVITNAIIIAFASSSFQQTIADKFPPSSQLAALVTYFVPHVPRSVRITLGRRAYRTAMEEMGGPDPNDQKAEVTQDPECGNCFGGS